MLALIVGVTALLVGALLGFWLRSSSAHDEKLQREQRTGELARDLETARRDLAQAQSESSTRAGFEALASEREKAIQRIEAERDGLRVDLQAKADAERTLTARVSELEAGLRNERQNMAEKLALLDNAKDVLSNQFEVLAGRILDDKSKRFSETSKAELGTLLDPLTREIKDFRDKVETAQSDSKTGVAKLEGLISSLGTMNQQLTDEARNLTTALRGSAKAQGDWGEFILRDLLEKAGLREGEQFSYQQSFAGLESEEAERRRSVRTDVILNLPGRRCLVVDSKVSLSAYTDYANAGTDEARAAALKLHLASVRGHVDGLAKAGYDRLPGLETPDFVVMFVPVEPAFLTALQNDSSLWSDAYQQGILLVGPTTLLYIIRIVNVLWQQELQARSVQDVMNRGTALYEKFVGFATDLEAIGKSLRAADQNYSAAMKKLTAGPGNLVRQVEMLKDLGIRTTKSLPRKLRDTAILEEPELALAAEAEDETTSTQADTVFSEFSFPES